MANPKGSSDAPQTLPTDSAMLRAALERLVLLECRSQTTPGPSAEASEIELSRWRDLAQRAEAQVAAVEAQRDRLFGRLMDAERLHTGLAGDSSDVDLASFIADLRSELARAEQSRLMAEKERSELSARLASHERGPTPADSPEAWAVRLSDRGLIPGPGSPLSSFEHDLVAGSAAERALLQGVLRDLGGVDASLRELAAERLAALPAMLSAPIFAAALSRERDPEVLAKLIRGAGLTRVGSLGPLLAPLKTHEDARVRAAVLFAETRLAPGLPERAWLADPDPRVRRRAAIAAAIHAPDAAVSILEKLAKDENAGVRNAAAAGASALLPRPDALLLRLAQDDAPRVRKTALRALGAPERLADEPPADRRRALREHLRTHLAPEAPEPRAAAVEAEPAVRLDFDQIEIELRSCLRGLTAEELASTLSPSPDVEALSEALTAVPERLLLRGRKWFVR